jgi:glycosyltransferase involved in cell wall biosynthesis
MNDLRIVHLLHDMNFGGVVRGLSMFERPEFDACRKPEVVHIDPRNRIAPRIDADLIVTHFAPNWATLPFFWSLRGLNRTARLVHVEHSYTGGLEAALVPDKRRFRAMLALALWPFDEIVCVSGGQARWLADAVPSTAKRVHAINPWGNLAGLDAVPVIVPPGDGPLVLGAYGRFDPVKRFDTLIAAMRLLPPSKFQLRLGGFGAEELRLRGLAEGLDHVTFTGRVEDVPAFLAACHAIVIPSRWETFGQVAEEAKGAGRPIVVANVDALPAHVGAAGLVADCDTPEALAAALKGLRALPLTVMGAAGRASLVGAAEDRAAQWLALYARATPRSSKSSVQVPMPMRISPGQMR